MIRCTRSAAKRAALRDLISPDNIQQCPSPQKVVHLTKQKENVKKKIKVTRTQSFRETFPGRLEWKRRHFAKPVTSTPTTTAKTPAKKDVQNCFGFDSSESDEEKNYSKLISPIPKIKPAVYQLAKPKETQSTPPPGLRSSIFKPVEISGAQQNNVGQEKEEEIQSIPTSTRTATINHTSKQISNEGHRTRSKTRTSTPEIDLKKHKRSNVNAKNAIKARSPTPSPPDLSSSLFLPTEKPDEAPNDAYDLPQKKKLGQVKKERGIASATTSKHMTRSKSGLSKPQTQSKKRVNFKTKKAIKARSRSPSPPDLSSSIFVDEVNEQYLRIKPSDIGDPGVQVKDFNDLLHRYNFDEEEEEEFRIDPARALRTYPSKRNSSEGQTGKNKIKILKPVKKLKKTKRVTDTKKTKPTGSRKFGKKVEYEDEDAATREWLEKKNKEFQEILKVNLIVERSGTQ